MERLVQLFNAFETTAVIFSLRPLTLVLHAGGPLSNETVGAHVASLSVSYGQLRLTIGRSVRPAEHGPM